MFKYFVLMFCVLCIAVGQVLFKFSANNLRESTGIVALFFDPIFLAAVLLYGLTTLGWVWCLQHMPLNRAYVFMSLAYIIVPVLGLIFFKEALNFRYCLSVLLIIAGVLCAVWQ